MSISADFSSTSATASVSSFTTATQGMESASPSTSIEQFRISETIRIRERLAELNSQNLRQYFQGVRSLYDELLLKKEEYEVEAIVHQENMKDLFQTSRNLKDQLQETRQKMEEGSSDLTRIDAEIKERIKKEAPELEEKINQLRELQKRLAYLQFTKTFTNLRDEIRRFLRKGNYQLLLENYRRLLRIPSENPEYCLDSQCRRDYSVKSASLAQFLQLELRSTLTNVFSRIHFPFEESIDLNPLRPRLLQSAQILKCLKLVNIETLAAAAGADLGLKGEPQPEPLELVLGEFSRRFNFHFYGDKPTNVPTKPEWFFAQLSYWAENNLDYFEQFIQPVLDEMYQGTGTAKPLSAKDAFLQHLMQLASLKVRELLRLDNFAQDRRQLSHLIDECVLFEREMAESFGYANPAAADQSLDPQSAVHVVSELCQLDEVLETWIKLERDTLSAGVDAILGDKEAYDPRYQEAADVDPYLVPNFADCFVILMQSMSERYRAIPDMRLQCRFLKLQLVIVDEFRSRIVQIGQSLQHNPFHTNFPQLMNALWYLIVVLEDWSDSHEFVRLQFSMQRLHSSESMATDSSTSLSSLARGTFDESASLYRHVWRQLVRSMCDAFAGKVRRRLAAYAAERWYDWDGTNRLPKPSDVTPSLEPFLRTVRELLGWIVANVSPDSVLTLHHLTNHEVWTVLDEEVISRTAFGYRGASQMMHDVTRALIPMLNHCYGKTKGAGVFDIYNEKCVQVLSSLRLLAMPPPAAILLKDELKHIPAHELDQKLEQFSVMGLTKARVMEVLEQRCDLGVLLDKLTT